MKGYFGVSNLLIALVTLYWASEIGGWYGPVAFWATVVLFPVLFFGPVYLFYRLSVRFFGQKAYFTIVTMPSAEVDAYLATHPDAMTVHAFCREAGENGYHVGKILKSVDRTTREAGHDGAVILLAHMEK